MIFGTTSPPHRSFADYQILHEIQVHTASWLARLSPNWMAELLFISCTPLIILSHNNAQPIFIQNSFLWPGESTCSCFADSDNSASDNSMVSIPPQIMISDLQISLVRDSNINNTPQDHRASDTVTASFCLSLQHTNATAIITTNSQPLSITELQTGFAEHAGPTVSMSPNKY